MELSRHIEILLLENDCVIVPGFGGFMAHYMPAEYVEEENTFYPPQRTLGFNPQLQLNDSLLALAYVEAYDISYPEAVRQIAAEVEEVRQVLSIEGKYQFHGLGTLKYNADGKQEFEPCVAGILTPSLYALGSFEANANANLLEKSNLQNAGANLRVVGGTDVNLLDEEEDKDGKVIHMNLMMLRNIAAAALLLLLLVFSSIPVGIGSNDVQQCSLIDTHSVASLVKAKSASDTLQPATESKKVDAKVERATTPQKKQENIQAGFTIVLASKVSKIGAEELVNKMHKSGFKSASIFEKGTMRRVILGSYQSEQAAAKALTNYRRIGENFTEAWISEI